MKLIKSNLFKYFSFLLIISILSACEQEQAPGTYKNAAIPVSKKEKFHELNDQFLKSIKANNLDDAKNMMSKELLDDNSINRTMDLISIQSKAGNYKVLDEYYLVAKTDEPGSLVINADAKGDDAYTVQYNQSSTKENYIAFLIIPKEKANQWLITAIYGKYNYGWKLNKIDIGLYAINGKSAPELYKLAKAQFAKGYWVDAAQNMIAAQRCFHPNGQWQYAKENAMNQFFYDTQSKAGTKYHFPFTISEVASKPKVFRITTEDTDDGTFPMIDYVSAININDTTALKKENTAIKKVIGKYFAGVDKDKKYVLYTAFDDIPGRKKNVQKFELKP